MSKKKDGSLKPGSTLGSYEIIRLIGKGGMGEVYEAYEPSLNRRVALKIIPKHLADKDAELVKRFDSEGKVLAQLNHPNVVIVHSLGQADGIHYLTMEYVDGVSLKEFILESSFSLEKALPIFQQIVAGVDALHNSGIIHRDMKPANVIYRKDGSIKIVDLGIAKVAEDTNYELTKAGEVVGSPLYMSPEVASGLEATAQSDLWGVGIIMFEMLTGENPFKDKTQTAILRKIKENDLEFSRNLLKSCPYELLKIIKRLCERDRNTRYKRARDVSKDLETFVKKRNVDIDTRTLRLEVPTSPTPMARSSKLENLDEDERQPFWLYVVAAAVVLGVIFTFFVNPKESDSTATKSSEEKISPNFSSKLISPENRSTVWQEKNQLNVTFEWATDSNSNDFLLQVSSDPQFRELVIKQRNPTNPYRASQLIPEKRYYWRILFNDGPGKQKSSTVSEFMVSTKQAPIPLFPLANARVLSDEAGSSSTTNSLRLEWQSKITVQRYRAQISRDLAFNDVVYDQTVNTSSVRGILVPLGNYYWRVRAVGEFALSDYWSQPIAFVIYNSTASKPAPTLSIPRLGGASKAKPAPPQINKPRVTTTLEITRGARNPSSLTPSSYPQLAWSSSKNSKSYSVQIAQDEGFNQVIEEQEVSKTSLQWKSVVPGSYYWRVAGKNDSGLGNYSKAGTVSSFFAAPTLTVPPKTNLDSKSINVNIRWKANTGSNLYILKVSPSKDFRVGENVYQVSGDSYDLNVDTTGLLYIRVAAINDRREIISEFSRVATLNVGRGPASISLSAPNLNSPNDGATVVGFAGITPVAFSWDAVKSANSYEIDFASDSGFTKSLDREISKETQFVLKKKLPNAKVYWRMRARKGAVTSPWTATRSFDVQAEGE